MFFELTLTIWKKTILFLRWDAADDLDDETKEDVKQQHLDRDSFYFIPISIIMHISISYWQYDLLADVAHS